MSKLTSLEKNVLEKYFKMEEGYVLEFTNKTMLSFFKDTFNINIYDRKYDLIGKTTSKANRLKAIWQIEDDATIGKIILELIKYKKIEKKLNPTIPPDLNEPLISDVKLIASKLLNIKTPKIAITDLNELSSDNFYNLCDVVYDINEELELTPKYDLTTIGIPIWKQSVKFPIEILNEPVLQQPNKHSEKRKKVLSYLMSIGVVKKIGEYSGNPNFSIEVDVAKFSSFFDNVQKRLISKYAYKDSNNQTRFAGDEKIVTPKDAVPVIPSPDSTSKYSETKLPKIPTNTTANKLTNIRSIIIVSENKNNERLLVINKKYDQAKKITKKTSKYIQCLADAIIDKTATLKLRNDTEKDNCMDYLNTNKKCFLYSTEGKQLYKISKIVTWVNNTIKKNGPLQVDIETECISQTKYKKRLSKQKNKKRT